jgi:hypothetical protein
MLARLTFAFTQKHNAGTVYQQVQRAIGVAVVDLDGRRRLPLAQAGLIRHGPI